MLLLHKYYSAILFIELYYSFLEFFTFFPTVTMLFLPHRMWHSYFTNGLLKSFCNIFVIYTSNEGQVRSHRFINKKDRKFFFRTFRPFLYYFYLFSYPTILLLYSCVFSFLYHKKSQPQEFFLHISVYLQSFPETLKRICVL